MSVAAAAMISAAALAAPAERLYQWYVLKDVALPTQGFTMGDKTRTLADFKGKVVVLNVWATWCTPCLKELPTLDKLEEKYAADGLVVLPLSLDTLPFEQLQGFIAKQKLELPHLARDKGGDVSRALMTVGLPVTYLIDREGVLRARFSGNTDWLAKENTRRIEALLAEGEAR